jgi:hydroxymethylpyrimidine/phosphomethylpyrimidine kinase
MRSALTIAGSDPSGGAGIQADLKTFHQHGVYGMAVIALVTVQNTQRVSRVEVLSADLVGQQLDAVLEDIAPDAIKTGALGSAAVIEAVAARFESARARLVVDPVMVSKHGHSLMEPSAQEALVRWLLPRTYLLTPNAHEAAALLGRPVETLAEAEDAARRIADRGPSAVLVKGGHLSERDAIDVLFFEGQVTRFASPRVDSRHTHGTGCTSSAAITAWLARGATLPDAVLRAKQWLSDALRSAPGMGRGIGPVNHLAPVELDPQEGRPRSDRAR